MSDKFYGEVIWFDPKRGYGFVGWTKDEVVQKDLFVHFSDVSCDGFKTLYKGQKITFGLGLNNRGDLKAIDVVVLKH
jgi:cold shock protein